MASSVTQECLSYQSSGGLLTTVAQLPPKYKIRYLAQTTIVDSPLDLSIKQIATINNSVTSVPITPPPSPPKKRYRDESFHNNDDSTTITSSTTTAKQIKSDFQINIQKEITPQKPIKITSAPKTSKIHQNNTSKEKKSKATRKLKFDEDTTSPVSGTIIRPLEEINDNCMDQSGDIDPQYNIVEVTEEAKAELATIKNVIGAYICKLCRIEFDDAFGLARHRCSCIVLLEYRCPECGKRFNCPANLASHRRWHKPKDEVLKKQQENSENQQFTCEECGKIFKRQAYLRKHLTTHNKKDKNNKDKCDESITKNNNIMHESKIKITTAITTPSSSSYRTDDSNSMESSSYYSQQNSLYQENHHYYKYDSDIDYPSDSSSPGRLHIVETLSLTEEENIAAAALAHLRNGTSVIQHTTAAAVAF